MKEYFNQTMLCVYVCVCVCVMLDPQIDGPARHDAPAVVLVEARPLVLLVLASFAVVLAQMPVPLHCLHLLLMRLCSICVYCSRLKRIYRKGVYKKCCICSIERSP
jgi:hypothetical protein